MCVNRHTFATASWSIQRSLCEWKGERQKQFDPFVRVTLANPVNEIPFNITIYSQAPRTSFCPLIPGTQFIFCSLQRKTTDKSVKLLLLISTFEKGGRQKNGKFAQSLNSQKFWRGFFFRDVLKRYPVIYSKMCKILHYYFLSWLVGWAKRERKRMECSWEWRGKKSIFMSF